MDRGSIVKVSPVVPSAGQFPDGRFGKAIGLAKFSICSAALLTCSCASSQVVERISSHAVGEAPEVTSAISASPTVFIVSNSERMGFSSEPGKCDGKVSTDALFDSVAGLVAVDLDSRLT